jgi:hypothetical protein
MDILIAASSKSSVVGSSAVTLDIEESFEQATLDCAEDIPAGASVDVDANGQWFVVDADVNTEAYGMATRFARKGSSLTAIRRGLVGGLDLSGQAFKTDLFVSNTKGSLSTTAGTNSIRVGEVFPVPGQLRGSAPRKFVRVDYS